MAFGAGPRTWAEMERVLSGRPVPPGAWPHEPYTYGHQPSEWVPPEAPSGPVVPYAELHTHSAYSFLDGASEPEELVDEAVRLDLEALAITDHDGLYGVVRFAEAARDAGLRTVFGAELTLEGPGFPEEGEHLLVLARGQEGYRRLSHEIAHAHLVGGTKGTRHYDLDRLTAAAGGHWQILTGCRKGRVRRALDAPGLAPEEAAEAAYRALSELIERFGRSRVTVELTYHGYPEDHQRNSTLVALAERAGVGVIASTAAHYAHPGRARLAMAMAAVQQRSSLDESVGALAPTGGGHLRSGTEMAELFAAFPGAVAAAAELGRECAFDLSLIAPQLPPFDVPEGHTEISWLRELTMRGAAVRYGPPDEHPKAYAQLEHELTVIEQLGFPGYFLVVHDIVQFCKDNDILCQGRGSAANSAVCFVIGVTNVDPVRNKLLFERFLAPERDGPPDIDVDIESDRREEAIQHVYAKYGREYAAQVANVITYRGKSAVRDMARALGHSQGQQDAWSKRVTRWEGVGQEVHSGIPAPVLELASQVEGLPRHLGIHSGGMVICDRPVADVCPVEWARMPGRTVLQWDKDDCAAAGLVKFDMLGLGMLSALHYMVDMAREAKGIEVDFARLDLTEPAVYEMLSRGDSVGVFQVESRAQMATLPRLKPQNFYDLVVEVALIRPGPIQGGSVHPYIRRRNGREAVTYEHPALRNSLERTLGIPLFQEQLMQMAVDVAGFSAADADQLRRAMGSKRSAAKMERLRGRFYAGMERLHGITGEVADRIFEKMRAFSNFGFPESHSQSFASLVFYSSWFKLHHPAIFTAGLLRAQPMGFYSPQSLVADAKRHGVTVHRADVNASSPHADVESAGTELRLGLAEVRSIGEATAQRIVDARTHGGPFTSLLDLTGRVELSTAQAEALATAGALGSLGPTRREALWAAGAAAGERPDRLPGLVPGATAPALPGMSTFELAAADVWATGVSPDHYPTEFLRKRLDELGVLPTDRMLVVPDGTRIRVAGAVTHRQRPATAAGVTFLNLEDETGMVNVVCSSGLWARYRTVATSSPALLVRGVIQNAEGVASLVADHLEPLELGIRSSSRNFQ